MRSREVEVCQRVGLGLPEDPRGVPAARPERLDGRVVSRPRDAGVPEAEGGRDDPRDAALRVWTLRGNASRESWLSVSTTPGPGTRRQPSSSQPVFDSLLIAQKSRAAFHS